MTLVAGQKSPFNVVGETEAIEDWRGVGRDMTTVKFGKLNQSDNTYLPS